MARTPKATKTFTKNGKERVAHSPADAVALAFDGWVEKPERSQPTRQTDSPSTQRTPGSGSASK
ncbi:hypothetical protein KBX50_05185 [Micromonospora sp. C51]|uniref:hypothetical protein n=1 Tax=Micromonospora sp. C51 TaxID=2824879 RepID=UPI001B36D7C4|nr:hypothetical protein [Micromonospora sp. C51]MBQ1047852.1 hypothetical protein [Micromonospora sp. C51]